MKIIKRNATPEAPETASAKRPKRQTATATVNNWITEGRRNRLERESNSRRTIEGWSAEAKV